MAHAVTRGQAARTRYQVKSTTRDVGRGFGDRGDLATVITERK